MTVAALRCLTMRKRHAQPVPPAQVYRGGGLVYCTDSSRTSKTDCEAIDTNTNVPYRVWLAEGLECEVITPASANAAANDGTPAPDCGGLIGG